MLKSKAIEYLNNWSSKLLNLSLGKQFIIFFFANFFKFLLISYLVIGKVFPDTRFLGVLGGDCEEYYKFAIKTISNIPSLSYFLSEAALHKHLWIYYPGLLLAKSQLSIIFTNSIVVALATTVLSLLTRELFLNKKIRNIVFMILLTLYFFSPIENLWFSQISKEAVYSLSLILFGHVLLNSSKLNWRSSSFFLISSFISLWLVRDYLLVPLVIFLGLFSVLRFILWKKRELGLLLSICFAVFLLVFGPVSPAKKAVMSGGVFDQGSAANLRSSIAEVEWKESKFLPTFLDKKLERVAVFRKSQAHLITSRNRASRNAMEPSSVKFSSFWSMVAYLPSAVYRGLLLATPTYVALSVRDSSFGAFFFHSIFSFFLAIFCGVVFIRGVLKSLYYFEEVSLISISYFISIMFAFLMPHLGSLARYRSPFFFIVILSALSILFKGEKGYRLKR